MQCTFHLQNGQIITRNRLFVEVFVQKHHGNNIHNTKGLTQMNMCTADVTALFRVLTALIYTLQNSLVQTEQLVYLDRALAVL